MKKQPNSSIQGDCSKQAIIATPSHSNAERATPNEQPDTDMMSIAGSELALNPSPMPQAEEPSANDELHLQDENDVNMDIDTSQDSRN